MKPGELLPKIDENNLYLLSDITLRDLFAAVRLIQIGEEECSVKTKVFEAYEYADEIIKIKNKKSEESNE